MQRRFQTLLCGAMTVVAGLFAANDARASLIGDTIAGQYFFPDSTTLFGDFGTATVGAGIEFPVGISGFTNRLNVDFAAATLTLASPANAETGFFVTSFNGYRFVDLTQAFTSVSIDAATNVAGFTMSNLTWSGDELLVNLSGLSLNGSDFGPVTQIVLDLGTASAVPEPTSLVLFGGGFAGLVGLLRRRQKAPAAA